MKCWLHTKHRGHWLQSLCGRSKTPVALESLISIQLRPVFAVSRKNLRAKKPIPISSTQAPICWNPKYSIECPKAHSAWSVWYSQSSPKKASCLDSHSRVILWMQALLHPTLKPYKHRLETNLGSVAILQNKTTGLEMVWS